MSFAYDLASQSKNRLIIPYPSQMYRSNYEKHNQALCFLLNKGYFETVELNDMLSILDNIQADTIFYIGKIEKIRLHNNVYVYRQRVAFRNLTVMLNLCRMVGAYFELGKNFHVTIDSLENCLSDLKSMKYYARRFNEPIDVWLTNCCIIHIHGVLKAMNLYTMLGSQVDKILYGHTGYLDRAPFLLASYDKKERTSSFYLEMDTNDTRLYSKQIIDKFSFAYGYTTANINKDRKDGLF